MTFPSFAYQIIILGDTDRRADLLRESLDSRLAQLGIEASTLAYLNATDPRDRWLPAIAVCFCSAAPSTTSLASLLADSIVIAPVVTSLAAVTAEVPNVLRDINAIAVTPTGDGIDRLANLVLETFRLLRRERRVFISYRRVDSQKLAELLYDRLEAHGFDVFLDTRSVPPAADVQAELWHRLNDVDVVVLIDTPRFRDSRWTTDELARANATSIQILHLLWPGQGEDSSSSFSHFWRLRRRHFWGCTWGQGRFVRKTVLDSICHEVESLRARALSARHFYLVDNFCDAARDLGLPAVVQSERWIAIQRSNGRSLAVMPAVGIPTADRLNDVFQSLAEPTTNRRDVWVLYDNRGILKRWLTHLEWLNSHLPVRAVRMSEAPDVLKALR